MQELRIQLKKTRKFLSDKFIFPILPRRQFRKLMIWATILFAAILAFHVYLFYRIESRTLFQAQAPSSVIIPSVNETKLAAVLMRFEDKAVIRSAAPDLVPAVPDPSR